MSQKKSIASDAFGEKMTDVINNAALALMISIGHQTGLFGIMVDLPPSTCEELAVAAKVHERYLREWLAAMVSGKIIEYDPVEQKYNLPLSHAAWLTSKAGADNFARIAQVVAMLGEVEQELVRCFQHGGGVPYEKFVRFHDVMEETSRESEQCVNVIQVIDDISGLSQQLYDGIQVAEFGCGSGNFLLCMARKFPRTSFTGYDFSAEAIAKARLKARQEEVENIRFEVQDISKLTVHDEYDFIIALSVVHDVADPEAVLGNTARALKEDGVFLMEEAAVSSHLEKNVAIPLAPLFYTSSCMHCVTVSLALNGEGLGCMWGKEDVLQRLNKANFSNVEVKQAELDTFHYYYVARQGQ
jgi:hypothetical protein